MDPTPLTPPGASPLLGAGFRRLDAALLPLLQTTVAAVAGELDRRSLETRDASEARALEEVRQQLCFDSAAFLDKVHVNLRHFFEKRLAGEESPASVYAQARLPELKLVDEAEIAETLLLQNLCEQLRAPLADPLKDLEQRLARLFDRPFCSAADNPLDPHIVVCALHQACLALQAEPNTRTETLHLFVNALQKPLKPVYEDLNALFEEAGITPKTHAKPASPAPLVSAQPPSEPGVADITQLLAQLWLRQHPFAHALAGPVAAGMPPATGHTQDRAAGSGEAAPEQGGSAGGAFMPGGRELPLGTAHAMPPAEVIHTLTRLQRGEGEVTLGEKVFVLRPEEAESGNVLRGLVDAGFSRHLGSIDSIVVDMVATIFDYLFEDERVPVLMKGLIGRLQLPVVKLAMMDHGFFANRQHPARRFINMLAQLGSTWDGELTADAPLFVQARHWVLRILDECAEEASIFEKGLAELEALIQNQEKSVDQKAATFTVELERMERQELMLQRARAVMNHIVARFNPPAEIRVFLEDAWLKVMLKSGMAAGEEGEAWRLSISTLEDLCWSLQGKLDPQDRQKLVRLLPGLLRHLRRGLESVLTDADRIQAFFNTLMRLHAEAIKAALGDTLPDKPPPLPRRADPLPPPPPLQTEAPELAGLKRGTWLELTDENTVKRRVRLTWISPAHTMYLFANRQGVRAMALTRVELLRRFTAGEARITEEEPLMDRIVGNVLTTFQAQS